VSAASFVLLSLAVTASLAVTPTAEQLKLLSQLSADQQAELLRALQKKPGVSKTLPLERPEVVRPRDRDKEDSGYEQQPAHAPEQVLDGRQLSTDDTPLKPFGYDLFAGAPTTFSPVTEIPIPVEYVIGPGDTVQVQLYGKDNQQYELQVDRDGLLQFPGIGPISVTGMRFDELKVELQRRIQQQMIGVQSHISLGELRSMRVFVLGDVNRPGAYMVSALSTMTNALFVSGGVRPIGSLRKVQLKRRGKLVQQLDLYDLLLHGDTSGDARMQPGDVIFVPPVGDTVSVAGEVRRPAIYELKKEHSVKQVLAMAGGMLPTAYQVKSQLERIAASGEKSVIDIQLSSEKDIQQAVENGDVLRVYSVLDKLEDVVFVSGHVQRPGGVQWHKGMRLSDVIPSIKALLPEPNLRMVLIRRERQPDHIIEVLASRLDAVFANPDSAANLALRSRDRVLVFGLSQQAQQQRAQELELLVQELRQQASYERPETIVSINGNVRWPGEYPLAKDLHLRDLLRLAGDMETNSDIHYVLLMRKNAQGSYQAAESFDLNPGQYEQRQGEETTNNPLLTPRDEVYVFAQDADRSALLDTVITHIKDEANVGEPAAVIRISGLVKSPGEYPLEEGMAVFDLLRAAGGLTESAYTLEAELSRYSIDEQDGRLIQHIPIQLAAIMSGDAGSNIRLQSYDSLTIKRLPNWTEQRIVELTGEVRFPGRYPVKRGETLLQLLDRAGGLTDQAFAEGAVFLRESLRKKEQDQIDAMTMRLESDLAAIDLEKAQANEENQRSVGMASSLLKQLKSTKAVGRLVIDLPDLLASRDSDEVSGDILLKDGDKLIVPGLTQEVTILGEVQHATSHLYREGVTVQQYINSSGGVTYRADEDRIYVVRANGAVVPSHSADWFGDNLEVRPGDTIVVPLDAERMKTLTLWTNISQIIYQIGIAAASWNAVGIF
jgi:protein involved in polysaccharide export with SLBB domain